MMNILNQIVIDIATDSWWAAAFSSLGPLLIFVVLLALLNIYVVKKVPQREKRIPMIYVLNALILISGLAGVIMYVLMKMKELGII